MAKIDDLLARLPHIYRDGELVRDVLELAALQLEIAGEDALEVQRAHWCDLALEQKEAAIPAAAFSTEVDETHRVVRVRIRATLPAAAAVGTVREAGLVARNGDNAVLYNRVTFAPLTKGNDHELTLFWVVSFPFGDLQGLM